MLPKRGEVWWADLGMVAKYRPVVVVSVAYGDGDYALLTVVPHTTSPRGTAFEVELAIPQLKPGHSTCRVFYLSLPLYLKSI